MTGVEPSARVAPALLWLATLPCMACAPEATRPLEASTTYIPDDENGDESDDESGDGISEGTQPDLGMDQDDETSEDGAAPELPPLYPGDRVHSPITPLIVDLLLEIRAAAPEAAIDLFSKIGASSTVSPSTLYCFATGSVDLDVHEASLGPTLDHYLAGETADATTPFDRDTLAAASGKTAGWAISGDPSPVDAELEAIAAAGPSLALVHYGANDMQQGITYATALPGYYANMSDLLDLLIARGVVPIVFGLSRRLDQPGADHWVQSYNAVARGLAQARGVPFVDLREALELLPGYGLSGDGLHLEGFAGGACVLTPEGLEHGYNIRNLIALEALDRTRAALEMGAPALDDPPAPVLEGAGSAELPFEIPALPFADSRDSGAGPEIALDVYTGCASMADESGPEHIYRLELAAPAAIRAFVLDRADVDVDLHLLDESASEAGCLLRDDTMIEATLEPGVYHFALDTYVDGRGVEQAGAYTFVVLECEADDPDCQV